MSNLDPRPGELALERRTCEGPLLEHLPGREVPLGGARAMTVLRSLPNRDRPTVGAWCFVDHFGPADVGPDWRMDVPPHPHTGLQTVSWLLEGGVATATASAATW